MGKLIPSYCHHCRAKQIGHCDRKDCPRNNTKFRNKNTETSKRYHSADWRGNPNKPLGERGGMREAQLLRKPNCEECEEEGVIKPATVVDHIKDWKKGRTEAENERLFRDPDNHRSLCESHHNSKTARTNK